MPLLFILVVAPFLAIQAQVEVVETTNEGKAMSRLVSIAAKSGFVTDTDTASVPVIIGLIIRAIISLVGLIFVILTVFAGFKWMTSQGNPETVKSAQASLQASLIGLLIALSAWTIWNFIINRLIL